MSFRWILLILVVCLPWLGSVEPSQAQVQDRLEELLSKAPDKPREVRIGVRVQQIKFVDQKAENFGIVGTLRLEWKDPDLAFDPEEHGRAFKVYTPDAFRSFVDENLIFNPGFVIQNQQGRRFSQQDGVIVFADGNAFYIEQFSAVLQAPDFDFTRFPFDTQTFYVRVVSTYPANYAHYVPLESYSQMGEKLGEEEWLVTDQWVQTATVEGITGLDSSRFSFGFKTRRHLDYYILRIFIPLVIFLLVSWASFFLEEYRKRIDIAGANLLIFVAFNFAISGDLPRLGYVTFLDFLLVAMFVITGLVIVFNVALRRLRITDREELARKIDNYALKWVYPLACGAIIFWAIYHFQYEPSLAEASG